MLTDQQIERYSRQIILPQVGGRGQEKLLAASVAIVGSTGLSAAAAAYLAAAGIGRLSVSRAAAPPLEAVNPDCAIVPLAAPITRSAATDLARACDVVVACGADDAACTVLNTACVAEHTPLVFGDARGALGCLSVLAGDDIDAPCYTCLGTLPLRQLFNGEAPAVLAEATAAVIGTMQATAAITLLVGMRGTPAGRLLIYDALAATVTERHVAKDPGCTTCGGARA